MKIAKSRVQQIIKEEVSRFLSERISMQDAQWVKQWREQLPDIIRKAGGKLHQGDLLDHGLKGVDINNFMGIIKMDPSAGEFLDGDNAGTKIVQSNDYLMIEEGLSESDSYLDDALSAPYHGKVGTGGTTTFDGRRIHPRDRAWLEFVPKGAPSITPEDMFRAVTLLDLSDPGVRGNVQSAIERGRNPALIQQIGDLDQYDIYSVYATTTG